MIVIMIPGFGRTHWAESEFADETLCGMLRSDVWCGFFDPVNDPAARPTCLVCLEVRPDPTTVPEPKTPELEKMKVVRERSQEIGDFLEWCRGRGAVLAVQHKHDAGCGEIVKDKDPFVNVINVLVGRDCGLKNDEYAPLTYNIEKLLAEYFQIDLERAESEKRALLDYIRAVNERAKAVQA